MVRKTAYLTKLKSLVASRRFKVGCAVAAGLFVIVNVATWAVYNNKTYPNFMIKDHSTGSVAYAELPARAQAQLPKQITLSHDGKKQQYTPKELGIVVDTSRIVTASQATRSPVPVLNFLQTQEVPLYVKVSSTQFDVAFLKIDKHYKQVPVDARLAIDDGSFAIVKEKTGYNLRKQQLRDAIIRSIGSPKDSIEIPVVTQPATVKSDDLATKLTDLKQQQQTKLTYHYGNKTKTLSAAEVVGLYAPVKDSFEPQTAKVSQLVGSLGANFGIRVQNSDEAVRATLDALKEKQALDFTFVPNQVSRTYTYCIRMRGVDAANEAGFAAKAQAVLNDTRGWSLGGPVKFVAGNSGCNMQLWLASADQMPTFGSICDSQWSCTVSPSVVINFDRWQGASDAWNAAGGSLDDYRSMVINHEVGHWLGFGHRSCGGAGQPAPVMQQQSINLQSCSFNAWPTAAELSTLRGWLGI